jgi:uncharacterized protein (DUF433 family)
MNWKEYIVTDPEILAGKPIVKGTRLSVDFVRGLFAEGWTREEVQENYPALSYEVLKAVFAYAVEAVGDESVYGIRRKTG